MERKTKLVQLGILIVILLAIGFAFLRHAQSNTEDGSLRRIFRRSNRADVRASAARLAQLKDQELLEGASAPANQMPASAPRGASVPGRMQEAAAVPQKHTNLTSWEVPPLTSHRAPSARTGQMGENSIRPSYVSGRSDATPVQFQGASGGLQGMYQPTGAEKAAALFDPYKSALTKEQAELLDKQLNGLSGRVERAILQAMLPKSKKNANIEKYLKRTGSNEEGDATLGQTASAFTGVVRQVKSQKTGVMKSMSAAYGNKAASEAGRIMDNFERELSSALSTPGQTPEQLAAKTRAINKKYNDQLAKTSEKYAKEKYEQERETKDNVFQQDLEKAYGSNVAGQMGEIIEKYRQQDLALAAAGSTMSAEEFYTQYQANQRARHKELEDMLRANGMSLQGLLEAENEQERQRVAQALNDEETGNVLAAKHRVDPREQQAIVGSIAEQQKEKTQVAKQTYGEAGAALVEDIYARYQAKVNEILADAETSLADKQNELMKARQQANAELEKMQQNPQMKREREDRQVQATLDQLMKDPGVAKASPEEQAAFKEHAGTVLHRMFAQINEIADQPGLSESEKHRQIQAVQQQAQRELAGQ